MYPIQAIVAYIIATLMRSIIVYTAVQTQSHIRYENWFQKVEIGFYTKERWHPC